MITHVPVILQLLYLAKCRECVIHGTGSMKCSNITVQTVGNRNIYGTGSISPRPSAIDQHCTLLKRQNESIHGS